MSGWVKLHRKALDNDVFRHDKTAWNVFETLLLVADSKNGKWSGGMHQLSQLCNIDRSTLYKAILRLERNSMVNRSVNARYTVYNICGWLEYQGNGKQVGKRSVNAGETLGNTLTRSRSKNKNILSKDNRVSKLYYDYLQKYKIPITNHNVLRSKIREMEKTNGEEWCIKYLNFMIDHYADLDISYKPEINNALDLFTKSKNIEAKIIKYKESERIY